MKTVQLTLEIQNMIVEWVKNIDGICTKLGPTTNDGYALRVPIVPSVDFNSKWLKATVSEVYIIIPEKEPPFFMIFEAVNKLSSFPFTGNIDMLSESLGFKLSHT